MFERHLAHIMTGKYEYGRLFTLANAITLGSLISSMLIIHWVFAGEWQAIPILFTIALICDGLDGFVARKTDTASELGMQLDSLTDAVAFGVVPAVVVGAFIESLQMHPSYIVQIFFVTCAVIRLARFNVQKDKTIFFGLNTPSSAAVVMFLVFILRDQSHKLDSSQVYLLVTAIMLLTSICMVSPFKYVSSKSIKIRVSIATVLLGVLLLLFSIWFAPYSLYAYLVLYALSGPTFAFFLWARKVLRSKRHS